MNTVTTFFKYALLAAIIGVGMMAFIVLIGEESPDSPLTFGQFFLMKAGAMGILYALYRIGKLLLEKGLLPDSFIKYMNEIDKEEV